MLQTIKASPGGVRNPFRKQQEVTKCVQSPLSLTERTLVEVHSTADTAENTDVSIIMLFERNVINQAQNSLKSLIQFL